MPSDEEIKKLHRKYAKSEADFALVYQHCVIIEAIAMQLLSVNPVPGIDRELLHVGCLLHDIGTYDVIENGAYVRAVRHGVIGEEILKKEGFPPALCKIASHHTGVGLTPQDVLDQGLPIPPADYTASTDEERLVMYADKFHTKGLSAPYFCTFEYYREFVRRYGEDKVEKFDALAERFGQPDIPALAARFGHAVKDIDKV